MSRSLFLPPPEAARAAARGIRLLALDVDGTLTDGQLTFTVEGKELKSFNVQDGQGIRLVQQIGIKVALVTARRSDIVSRRASELGIWHVIQGSNDKAESLRSLCLELGIALETSAFMGDDLPDLAPMAQCGLSIAPADARPQVSERAVWVTRARGGRGAVREVCDGLIAAQGQGEALLSSFLPATSAL